MPQITKGKGLAFRARMGFNPRMHPRPPLLLRWLLPSVLLAVAAAPACAADLQALRLSEQPGQTRAVLDLSAPVEYKLFLLENPHRLVLDLHGSSPAATLAIAEAVGAVQGVRTGRQDRQDLRVVLDLASAVRAKSFLLPPGDGQGHRLVVDLEPQAAGTAAPVVRTVEQAMGAGDRDLLIAIDAGHGGKDPGAIGAGGTYEKNVTLAIARELKRQVDAEPGMRGLLVRGGDQFIPLAQRYQIAREAKADLFVSIHADSVPNRTASGSSVYVMSTRGATSQAARWLAERENRADLVGGISLSERDDTLAAVLLDLSQSGTMKASEDVAAEVLDGLKRIGKVHSRDVQRANFVVLRAPDVPSVLVESAYISNPDEEKRLKDPGHQKRLASAIRDGIRGYFSTRPPPGTWLAANGSASAREHVVGRGDTLSGIAQRHGISLSQLRAANRINGDVVRVGERLRIPALGPG